MKRVRFVSSNRVRFYRRYVTIQDGVRDFRNSTRFWMVKNSNLINTGGFRYYIRYRSIRWILTVRVTDWDSVEPKEPDTRENLINHRSDSEKAIMVLKTGSAQNRKCNIDDWQQHRMHRDTIHLTWTLHDYGWSDLMINDWNMWNLENTGDSRASKTRHVSHVPILRVSRLESWHSASFPTWET